MDIYQFIAALFAALAWPAAVVALGLTFRKPLLAILRNITTVEAGGVILTVAQRSEMAVEDLPMDGADRLPLLPPFEYHAEPEPQTRPSGLSLGDASNLAEDPNVSSVMRAYGNLVAGLRRASPGPHLVRRSARELLTQLYDEGRISSDVYSAARSLQQIRSDVAHGRVNVTTFDALTFDKAVESVLAALQPSEKPAGNVATSIVGQSELATMSFDTLAERLRERFGLPEGQ